MSRFAAHVCSNSNAGRNIQECCFTSATMNGAILQHARIFDCELSRASLEGAIFNNAQIRMSRFREVFAARSNFSYGLLASCDFRGARMVDSKFFRTDASASVFRQSILSNCDFREAKLKAADFTKAVLALSRFGDASMCFTDLRAADLKGARELSSSSSAKREPGRARFSRVEAAALICAVPGPSAHASLNLLC